CRVLIVDNGSTDSSESILRERFPDVGVIQSGTNLGFAGGNNIGIRYALKNGADYVWLLNNDTIVMSNALSELVQVAETKHRIGMVGSKVVYFDNPEMLWYAGAILDPKRPHRLHHLGLREKDNGQYETVCETGYVTGCSLLARVKMIKKVGMLDEGLFLYFEDSDWSIRAKTAGWQLMYAPAAVVRHKESVSTGGAVSPTLVYYMTRNRLYFVRRFFPSKFAQAFCYVLYEHIMVNIKKRRFSAASAAVRGTRDFLLGRIGRMPERTTKRNG
ncbi:MAG: glycosyltransferase family 2 protein, partial [Geoalkalibacter sp.]|uniref:glycosyltransferase family 2 protein n=1 Tax=Geoalkalibacter sp. TaxID=3041440 RepID=UPI003D097163